MKKISTILFAFLAITMVSCSSSDDDGGNNNQPITGNYLPNTVGDFWIYNVNNESATNSELDFSETDLLTVATSSATNTTFSANQGVTPAYGVANDILTSGFVSKTESTLSYTGNLDLPDEFNQLGSSISVSNMLLYDLNASVNSDLFSLTDAINDNIDINGSLIPITINYQITSKKLGNMNSLTVDGESYADVLKTKVTVNMTGTASISIQGNPVNVTFLEQQDVMVMDVYFAKDVGIIKTESNQSYILSQDFITIVNQIGGTIAIPTEFEVMNTQELDNYIVN